MSAEAVSGRPPTPDRANLWLSALACALSLWQYFAVPLLIAGNGLVWAWTLLPGVLLTNGYWALIHEGIHHRLHSNSRVSDAVGRVLCILYGSPMRLLRCGHLLHHRYNRTEFEQPEVFEAGGNRWAARFSYYFTLTGGLYVMELASTLLAFLPRRALLELAARLDAPRRLNATAIRTASGLRELGQVRLDAALSLLLVGAAFWCYGQNWWVLAMALWGRGFLISTWDQMFHYDTPYDRPRSGYDAQAPRWLAAVSLNFLFHGTHHAQPDLPWNALPAASGARRESWSKLYRHQFKGPVYRGSISSDRPPNR